MVFFFNLTVEILGAFPFFLLYQGNNGCTVGKNLLWFFEIEEIFRNLTVFWSFGNNLKVKT